MARRPPVLPLFGADPAAQRSKPRKREERRAPARPLVLAPRGGSVFDGPAIVRPGVTSRGQAATQKRREEAASRGRGPVAPKTVFNTDPFRRQNLMRAHREREAKKREQGAVTREVLRPYLKQSDRDILANQILMSRERQAAKARKGKGGLAGWTQAALRLAQAAGIVDVDSPRLDYDLKRTAAADLGTIASGPFVGGLQLGLGAVDAAQGDTRRLEELAKGVWEGAKGGAVGQLVQGNVGEALRQAQQHPLLTALDVGTVTAVAGRTAGAVARGAGSTAAAGGVRGGLARAGSTVRAPLALSDDPAAALSGLLHERSFSKDLTRKGVQVSADRLREPLRDAQGNVVTVMQRGREVPVLKASALERDHLLNRRGDFTASRANSVERLVRDEAGRAEAATRATRDPRLRAANEIVSMATEGTIRSAATFVDDLRAHRQRVERAFRDHESGKAPFRHEGELEANRARAKAIDRVLSSPKAVRQGEAVFAANARQAGMLNAAERRAIDRRILDPAAARRAKLTVWAQEHLGGRHVTVEEHGRLEAAARKVEDAARERVRALPEGSPERAVAQRELAQARAQRIAVSGRDPAKVVAHERALATARNADAQARKAEAQVARLERSRQRLSGAQAVQRGPEAARRMAVARGAVSREQGVLRYIDQALADPKALSRGAAKERQRAKVRAKVEADLKVARARAAAARQEARKAAQRARETPLPSAQAGMRGEGGRFLSNREIEADIVRHRGEGGLDTIAYLPQQMATRGARAHHTQFRAGGRPRLETGETRTGAAYARGVTDFGRELTHDELTRKATQIAKAEQIDRLVGDAGMRHPAWAKAQRGEKLSPAEKRIVARGGYFTAREAEEIAKRAAERGERLVPVRAFGTKASKETLEAVREEFQQPVAFQSLEQRLLNDRILRPDAEGVDLRARNVVLMPEKMVERLNKHLTPADDLQKSLQFMNRAFRMAVLPQPRWLTGNFIEPFVVRLTASGSGLNVFGLAADIRAGVKTLRAMERSGDPRLRQAAKEIRAQQLGGLFIGGRGATVRRTAEELPGVLKLGAVVREMPVVGQMVGLAGGLLNGFFRVNRVIEGVAQRAALGKAVRADVREFTGSWWKSVRLGQKAAEEAAKGLVGTPTQHRFMRQQHELLGQYEGFSPRVRSMVQGALPFLPWALSAARFTMWTMPVHHTILTNVLIKTEQAAADAWAASHDVPPGGLELALPTARGGFVDLARYTPWGLSGPVAKGDYGPVVDQVLPQLSGAMAALRGQDPFDRQLKVKPTASNPKGLPDEGDKALIAGYGLAEALVPYLATVRRLREGGGTPFADSTVVSPKTKPGTSHMSAARRTFDPFRPVYLGQPKSKGGAPGRAGGESGLDPADLLDLREAVSGPDVGLDAADLEELRQLAAAGG